MTARTTLSKAVLVWYCARLPAFACAVCFSGTEATRNLYLGITVALSLLPMAGFTAFVVWYRRRLNQLAAADRKPPVK